MTAKIENAHLLTDRFGRWPSFHDSEVIRACFEREGADAPYMECDIYLFASTGEVDSKGYYILCDHTLATLRFCDIDLAGFEDWNNQNVLFDLKIGELKHDGTDENEGYKFEVELAGVYGCSTYLQCNAVKVIKVEEYEYNDQSRGPYGPPREVK